MLHEREQANGAMPDRADEAPPVAPRSVQETGLSLIFLVELAVKIILLSGPQRLAELSRRIGLSVGIVQELFSFMRRERLCEVAAHGVVETEVTYGLTDLGRARGEEMLRRNRYAGPAPVDFDAYVKQVRRQSVRNVSISPSQLRAAFDTTTLDARLLDRLGAALNSERAIFLYGPGGTGKSHIAERLAQALPGEVFIPHAVAIDGEVITMLDALLHRDVGYPDEERLLDRKNGADARWVRCRRPAVVAGGELTLDMLELQFDPTVRFYDAPPQVKANNGVLVIDDLGRQRVEAQELMNRWIVPLDRGVDYLALHTGRKFQIPFDVTVIFCTNLSPAQLADGSFLRRLGHKIPVGPLSETDYRSVFRQACEHFRIAYSEAAMTYLLRDLHARHSRPLFACYPADLLRQLYDRARYLRRTAELTPETMEMAWTDYFADADGDSAAPAQPAERAMRT